MRKGNLSREQAVKMVGEKMVDAVESENCDFTGRLQTDGDESIEFSASVRGEDLFREECILVAYYYQDQEDLDAGKTIEQGIIDGHLEPDVRVSCQF